MYEQDTLSALDAITEAQRIAFAPMLFQAALCLRNAGILDYLDQQGKQGAPLNAITEHTVLNEYAVGVLLDMGLSGRIITCKEGIYYLAKIGHYLLHDTMTRVNMDFTQDVCYQGLFFLADSLNEGKPSGLKVFGDWRRYIRHFRNYQTPHVIAGLRLIITIQMAHLTPHCLMYSPTTPQPCTMWVAIRVSGLCAAANSMKTSPLRY